MRSSRFFLVGVIAAGLVACSSASSRTGFPTDPPPDNKGNDKGGTGTLGGTGDNKATLSVTLNGTVMSPNGTLPMSNALVYVTNTAPGEIPSGAYCDECVALPKGTFTTSGPDGKFELTTQLPKGKSFIVTQKGQFRRVREIEVDKEDTMAIDKELTTLPPSTDASAGDTSPRMLILKDSADYDKINESLNKLGIKDITIKNDHSLLEDAEELMKYHVVFIPCGHKDDALSQSSTAQANLQNFVKAGGKLYVTDWSYEFVRQPFPGLLDWEGETDTLGSAASLDLWGAPATATDEGLGDWLSASGNASFSVEGNWTKITSVNTVPGLGPKGENTNITPKVWVTADKDGTTYPTTVSFAQQCGRVLFSTYHTEDTFSSGTLAAQEKALLYVLLDVGVCSGEGGGVH